MPSPFPGMNPYLEGPNLWVQFHDTYIITMQAKLATALKHRYFVGVHESVYIHEMPDEPGIRIGKPDLSIKTIRTASEGSIATLEAPARARIINPVDELRVPYLAITDRNSDRVVTVIEVLSPSNKALGADRDQYIAKRRRLLDTPANLVEIDLLRGGPRLPAEEFPDCDYSVVVSRPASRPVVEVWPIKLREKLPTIAIPLQVGDIEPQIDLQQLLHEVYDATNFEMVAYRHKPEPPLAADDAAWAQGIIAAALST